MVRLGMAETDVLVQARFGVLLRIRASEDVTWPGRHRPPLTGQGVYPRPVQDPLPIWVGVGGTPESFARAGLLGLPLMVAIIGGVARGVAPAGDALRRPAADARAAPGKTKGRLPVLRLL